MNNILIQPSVIKIESANDIRENLCKSKIPIIKKFPVFTGIVADGPEVENRWNNGTKPKTIRE